MEKPLRLLIVEDSEDDVVLVVRHLRQGGFAPVFERVETAESMAAALHRQPWDLVIADYSLPRFSGLAALALLKETEFDLPFIVVSGTIGEDLAVEAMKAGAHDYILKGNLTRLLPAVQRELREAKMRQERRQATEDLRRSRDELRALTRHLESVREEERNQIARDLHDETGGLLVAVYIVLDDCARDLPPDAQDRLKEVRALLDQVEEQLRRLSHELRPAILEDLGVVPALQWLAEGVSKRTDLAITVEGDTKGRLPASVETVLYRCVQEGLTNAARHAKANSMRIQLQREAQQIRCTIRDNGIGFDLPAVLAQTGDRGLGLLGMRERLKALDGALQITTAPGQGTALLITIPLGA
ncbi:MAG TPA: response regulator [Verrucomicrobiae bacterium]|nr:response regulator [Verrucomicrobiae bacterium]